MSSYQILVVNSHPLVIVINLGAVCHVGIVYVISSNNKSDTTRKRVNNTTLYTSKLICESIVEINIGEK